MCSSPKIPPPPPPPPPPQEMKAAEINTLRKKPNQNSGGIAGGTLLTGTDGAAAQTMTGGTLLGG